MTERSARGKLPPLTSLIPGGLVTLGVILWMTAGKAWIVLCGLGAFAPGILRELGWLHDLDEFQREASRRAAYHAYLVGGMVTTLVVTGLHLDGRPPEFPAELITFLLVVFWLSWMFSYLMAYWGPKKTASGVLLSCGGFWFLFALLDTLGSAGSILGGIGGFLGSALFVSPFWLGAYAAHRWPRPTGRMLLVAAVAMAVIFVLPSFMNPRMGTWTRHLLVPTILVGPLLASGVGLLRFRDGEDAEPTVEAAV